MTLSAYAKCDYAKCRYAECHNKVQYAECRYAECHSAECRYVECRCARFDGSGIKENWKEPGKISERRHDTRHNDI